MVLRLLEMVSHGVAAITGIAFGLLITVVGAAGRWRWLLPVHIVLSLAGGVSTSWLVFLSLRWLAGLVGTLGLAWMTWLTLKIPNTQSATGILYAAMILAFIGELTAQLMSARGGYPL